MSFDFSKLTKTQITKMIRNTAPIANAKLKEMRSKGYDKFNYSMIRKYNTMTNYAANPKTVTKKDLFRTGTSHFTKEQLIKRYELMTEFINNDYASVAYTERHLAEMRDKWSLSDDEIKDMFELYREYGYDNFTDSDGVLTSFSKLMNDASTKNPALDPRDYLKTTLESISNDLDNKGMTEDDYISALRKSAKILTD